MTNIGTFPIKIDQLKLTETNAGDYNVGALVRTVMEPGQTEFYEVTYSPQAAGTSSGTLEIVSNAVNGPHIVTLGGEATVTAPAGGDDGAAIRPGTSLTGWGAAMKNGTLLWQSTPNPTGERADIRYYVPAEGSVEIKLFGSDGKLVKELVSDVVAAGEHKVSVNVSDLSSGRYYYTMRTASGALTLAMDVVK